MLPSSRNHQFPGRGFVESEVLVFLPNFVAKAKGLCFMQSSPRPGTQPSE